jgi:hypothetical protein
MENFDLGQTEKVIGVLPVRNNQPTNSQQAQNNQEMEVATLVLMTIPLMYSFCHT